MPAIIDLVNGKQLDYLDINPQVLTIDVVANGLAMRSRFIGQTHSFLSVAEHSVAVAKFVEMDPISKLNALLHDAEECILPDVPTPLKKLFGDEYRELEEEIRRRIHINLGIPYLEGSKRKEIKEIDKGMFGVERLHAIPAVSYQADKRCAELLPRARVRFLSPAAAKQEWLKTYRTWYEAWQVCG